MKQMWWAQKIGSAIDTSGGCITFEWDKVLDPVTIYEALVERNFLKDTKANRFRYTPPTTHAYGVARCVFVSLPKDGEEVIVVDVYTDGSRGPVWRLIKLDRGF